MGMEGSNMPVPPQEEKNELSEQEEYDREQEELFQLMTPEEQKEELVRRQKTKESLERSKIIDDMPALLRISEEEAGKLYKERMSIAHDYMVDGSDSLIKFLQKLKNELEAAPAEEEKTEIRKKYLGQFRMANEYLTGLG
jgi:hypothetical protein